MDTTITKINDTTLLKEIVTESQVITVERTMSGIDADIQGTQAWIDTLESDLIKARSQLQQFLDEKEEAENLGLVHESEVIPEVVEETEEEPE